MAKKQAVVLVSRSYDEAANLMWNYYSANKLRVKIFLSARLVQALI